jgi:GNAT superfamily N-acetyltransferase
MDIRLAEENDLGDIVRLMELFVAQHLPESAFVKEVAEASVSQFLKAPVTTACVMLCEDKGCIEGMFIASTAQRTFSYEVDAVELAFYVDPSKRSFRSALKLLGAYEYWAKEVAKATWINLSCIDERVASLYTRKGYIKTETAFRRKL